MQLPLPFLVLLKGLHGCYFGTQLNICPLSPRINTGPYSAVSYALQPGEPHLCQSPADCEILSWKILFRNLRFHGARHTKTGRILQALGTEADRALLPLLSHPGPEFVNRHLQFICFQTQTPIDRKF